VQNNVIQGEAKDQKTLTEVLTQENQTRERKNLNRNESSFLSPPVLLKKGKEVTKVTI